MLRDLPEHLIENALVELKKSDLPVFIFGGEKLARKIKFFLDEKDIKVNGFLINKKFWKKEISYLYGCPVYILEDFFEENICNLIIAFAGYEEIQLAKYGDKINKLYVLDFIGALCMEDYYSSISKEFYVENKKNWLWLEEHLYDEKSIQSLEEFIMQRMSGIYKKEIYEMDQYFPNDIIELKEEEIFVDCGAYHGENTVDFINCLKEKGIKNYKKIYCIEADQKNVKEMKKVLEQYERIEIICAGVWNEEGTMTMDSGYERTSRISADGTEKVNVKTIDTILDNKEATFIKMDIEGSEINALYGAEKTILKYKPKLAICLYHKPEDLIEIPKYIYSLRKDYQFYIRNHSPYGIETVLYAV